MWENAKAVDCKVDRTAKNTKWPSKIWLKSMIILKPFVKRGGTAQWQDTYYKFVTQNVLLTPGKLPHLPGPQLSIWTFRMTVLSDNSNMTEKYSVPAVTPTHLEEWVRWPFRDSEVICQTGWGERISAEKEGNWKNSTIQERIYLK